MQTLSVHHPEIETFVKIKRDLKKVTGANISVRLSDAFLQAVEDGTDYVVQFPVGEPDPAKCLVYKKISARGLWSEIMDSAWQSAEPGLLFWDTVIRRSPADCYADVGYKTVSTNPCITKDSWVLTSTGPRQVADLIGKPFNAIVNGNSYSARPGFVKTGHKTVFEVITKHGFTVKATDNHKFKTPSGWVELKDLNVGDELVLNNHAGFTWQGKGTKDEGWLLGNLLGDGTFSVESTRANLCYWGETKTHMLEHATSLLKKSVVCRADLGSSRTKTVNDNTCSVIGSTGLYKLAVEEFDLRNKQINKTLNMKMKMNMKLKMKMKMKLKLKKQKFSPNLTKTLNC
jgi:ribonucleoside-diphosphate reductase alpha chain